jgi:hypothetical protein
MGTHFTGGLNMRPVAVTDATTYTVLAKNSGKLHVMPDLTADCTITLPTVEAGLKFEFMYAGAADDAQDWIIVTAVAGTDFFKGGITQLDPAEATVTEVVPVYSTITTDDTLTILTPNAGTIVTLVCDGVFWLLNGFAVSDTPPTLA